MYYFGRGDRHEYHTFAVFGLCLAKETYDLNFRDSLVLYGSLLLYEALTVLVIGRLRFKQFRKVEAHALTSPRSRKRGMNYESSVTEERHPCPPARPPPPRACLHNLPNDRHERDHGCLAIHRGYLLWVVQRRCPVSRSHAFSIRLRDLVSQVEQAL